MAVQIIGFDQDFGGSNTPEKSEFVFKNFKLRYLHIRKISKIEVEQKTQSIQSGYDGGHTVKDDAFVFEVVDQKTNFTLEKIELSRLPFGNASFSVQGHSYQLRHSPRSKDLWHVIKLK